MKNVIKMLTVVMLFTLSQDASASKAHDNNRQFSAAHIELFQSIHKLKEKMGIKKYEDFQKRLRRHFEDLSERGSAEETIVSTPDIAQAGDFIVNEEEFELYRIQKRAYALVEVLNGRTPSHNILFRENGKVIQRKKPMKEFIRWEWFQKHWSDHEERDRISENQKKVISGSKSVSSDAQDHQSNSDSAK
jgi:hypothetical protein